MSLRKFKVRVLLFTVVAFFSVHAQETNSGTEALFPIEENGRWGYIDRTGKVVIEPRFNSATEFSEGFAGVEVKGQWGFIDKSGKLVIEPRYSRVSAFSEGLARVQVAANRRGYGIWGFIDHTGEWVIEPEYQDLTSPEESDYSFHNGLAMIEVNYKKGFIDKTGRVVIEPRFSLAYSFSEGLASVRETMESKWGYIDTTGQWAIPPSFEWSSDFTEGFAPVALDDGGCAYINRTGALALQPKFKTDQKDCAAVWGSFDGGLSRWKIGDKFGYINKAGEIVIKPEFDLTYNFSEGMAFVVKDEKYGFVNETAQMIVQPQFYYAKDFHNGLARVFYARDRWGYIDKTGRFVWKQPAVPVLKESRTFLQPGHTRDLGVVGWSPDGSLLASNSPADGWIKIWNPKTGELLWNLSRTDLKKVKELKSPDRNLLASFADEFFEIRDASSGKLIWIMPAAGARNGRVASPDGREIAEPGSYGDAVVKIFDAKTNQLLRRLGGHPGIIYAIAFSADGKIATGSGDRTIRFWEPQTGALVKSLYGHTEKITSIAFSTDAELLVSGSDDDTVNIWNVSNGRLLRTIMAFTGGIKSVAVSPDRRFVVAGSGTRIQVWETETGKQITTLETHESHTGPGPHGEEMGWCCGSDVVTVVFSPDGSQLVSAHDDGTIKFWNIEKSEPVQVIKGRFSDVRSVVFSPDGKKIAVGYNESDSRVDLFSVQSGKLISRLGKESDYVHSLAFSNDGKLIVTGHMADDVKLWDARTGKLIRQFKQPYSQGDRVAFSPDGKYIVSGGENQNVMLWDVQTGKLIWSMLAVREPFPTSP